MPGTQGEKEGYVEEGGPLRGWVGGAGLPISTQAPRPGGSGV